LVDASDQGSVGGSRLSLRSSNVITLGGGGRVFQCLNNIAWPLLGCWPWDRLQAPLQLRPWLAVLADACYPRATKDGDPGKKRESAAGWPIPEPDGRPGDPGTLQPCVPAGIHPLRPVQAFAPVPKRLSEGRWIIGIGSFGVREDIDDVLSREPDDACHLVATIHLIDLGPVSVLLTQGWREQLRAGDRLIPKASQSLHGSSGTAGEGADAEQTVLGVLIPKGHSKNRFGVAQLASERHK
jgi:hypothetical protein